MRSSNYTEIIDWLEEGAAQAHRSQNERGVRHQIDLFWRFVSSLHSTRAPGRTLGEDERLTIQEAQARLARFVWWLEENFKEENFNKVEPKDENIKEVPR